MDVLTAISDDAPAHFPAVRWDDRQARHWPGCGGLGRVPRRRLQLRQAARRLDMSQSVVGYQ